MTTTIRFNIRNHQIAASFGIRKRKKERVFGYTNRCKDGKYIITLDYDNIPLNWLIGEISRLQEDYELSTFYIFKSSQDNYHAVCFDKLLYAELISVMRASTIDQSYINVPMKFGKKIWTLRATQKEDQGKPRFWGRVISPYDGREKSTAHINMVEKFFLMKANRRSEDREDRIILSTYMI